MADIQKMRVALTSEQVAALRDRWDEGKASGPAEPFDIERTIAAAQARHRKTDVKATGAEP